MSWWKTGFPVEETATIKQLKYLSKRLHLALEILPSEDACVIKLMGENEWLASLSKEQASVYISKIKMVEERGVQELRAQRIIEERKAPRCVCGAKQIEVDAGRQCPRCGKVEFHVKLR